MHLRRPQALSLLVATALACFATPSRADPPVADSSTSRLPLALAQRPLTLPRLVLAPRLELDLAHSSASMAEYIEGAAAFGITDDLEVGALVLPLQLATPNGKFQYGQTGRLAGPSIGVTYRFVRGRFELGLGANARVFTVPDVAGFSVTALLPARFHATDAVRIDVTPSVEFVHSTIKNDTVTPVTAAGVFVTSATFNADQNPVRLFVPVRLIYNVEEAVHVGVNSGLTIYELGNASNTTGIPFGVFGGYAVGGPSGAIVDFDPFLNFPYLIIPGRRSVTNTEQWVIGLNVIGHVYL